LKSVGLDVIGFVKFVANNFTQILADYKNKSLLLAYVPEIETAKVVIMTITSKDGIYFVKTASPMGVRYLKNKTLLWIRK
jgi:hypothetical protein